MSYLNSLQGLRNVAEEIRSAARSGATKTSASGLMKPKEKKKNEGVPESSTEEMLLDYITALRGTEAANRADLDTNTSSALGEEGQFSNSGVLYGGFGSLTDLIDQTEGGGSYKTLYGHSQKSGGRFEGMDITTMTLGELKDFTSSSGEYGHWVKSNNPEGDFATPLGRYQFVGKTLREVAGEMGLSDDTKFTPEVQDKMFAYYARKRLKGLKTSEGKRKKMRSTWAGFKKVSDNALDRAISDFETSTTLKPKLRKDKKNG